MAVVADLGWGPTINTGANFYVAVNGDDKNEGSINAPWQTITRAQSFIRKLISDGVLPAKGVTVWLRGGRYPLPSSLLFTSADRGTPGKPIIYRAFQHEAVSLFSGEIVDPSKWRSLNKAARNRVHPKVNSDNLRELDIAALGVLNADKFPDKFVNWSLFDLVVDDLRQPVSQWPNPKENLRGVNEPGFTTCNGSKDIVSFYYAGGGKPVNEDQTNEVGLDGTKRIDRWKKSMDLIRT